MTDSPSDRPDHPERSDGRSAKPVGPSDEPQQPEAAAAGAEQQIGQLQQELLEAQQRVLRAQADLENFRRRMRRETEVQLKFATQPLISELLPVVDNIQRAIQAADKAQSVDGLVAGFKMVQQQLMSVLENHHCRQIPAEGTLFDPQRHEAVAQQPTDQYPPGTVTAVQQEGYQLRDRVIRPAQVVVAAPPESTRAPAGKSSPTEEA